MPPTNRRPRLSDILLMVAAAAVGLATFKLAVSAALGGRFAVEGLIARPARGWRTGQVVARGVEWIGLALPFAAAWTFTVPVLRLRPPRPRRFRSDAGFVACVAAITGFLWATIVLGLVLALDRAASDMLAATPERWLFHYVVEQLFADVGLAVAAAWLGLFLSGRWRRSTDWIDRSGRVLGIFWIVSGLVWGCRRYFSILDW